MLRLCASLKAVDAVGFLHCPLGEQYQVSLMEE